MEEAEGSVRISQTGQAASAALAAVSTSKTDVGTKMPADVASNAQQTAEKSDSDSDQDSGVGSSDSDDEDDKELSKLENQVDDFEAQQQQAMAEVKDATDSP